MDVLLLLISVLISLRVFFPRASRLVVLHDRFLNELFSTVSISLLALSLVFLLLYDLSVLNVVLIVVTFLILLPMLVRVERRIFSGLALTFFAAMAAASLFKVSAVSEIFAVLSFSLLVMTFLKDFLIDKQYED